MTELALPGMGRELGIGLLIGAGLYTACILMVMGIYRIDWLNPVSYLLPAGGGPAGPTRAAFLEADRLRHRGETPGKRTQPPVAFPAGSPKWDSHHPRAEA